MGSRLASELKRSSLAKLHLIVMYVVMKEAYGFRHTIYSKKVLAKHVAWCREHGISEKEIRREYHHGITHAGAIMGTRQNKKHPMRVFFIFSRFAVCSRTAPVYLPVQRHVYCEQ